MYGFTTKRASTESTAGWCVAERCAEISPGPGVRPEESSECGVTRRGGAGLRLFGGRFDGGRGHPNSVTCKVARRGCVAWSSEFHHAYRGQARMRRVVIRFPSRVKGPGADAARGHPNSITRNGARRGYIRALRMRITVPLGRLRRFGGIA